MTRLDRTAAWADLFVALSNCLRKPDETLVASAQDGTLAEVLTDTAMTLEVGDVTLDPPTVRDLGPLTESYLSLFQAMETPYAPPAESPYKPWYDDRTGLMGGPAAEEMAQRYPAVDADVPDAYPADHVALLLEYGSILLEAGEREEFAGYVDAHFDWVPALRLATEGAAAEAPFHRWAVTLLDEAVIELRDRLGLDGPAADTVRLMVDRLPAATTPD